MFVRAFVQFGLPLFVIGFLSTLQVRAASLFIAASVFLVGCVLLFSFMSVPFPAFLVNCSVGAILATPGIMIPRSPTSSNDPEYQ
jgi:hypothetical protein